MKNASNPDKPSSWSVYGRLFRYALHYKYRLALSILFSLVLAVSFSSMILALGGTITLMYDTPEQVSLLVDSAAAKLSVLPYCSEEELRDLLESWAAFARVEANRGTVLGWLSLGLILVALVGGVARFLQEYFSGSIAMKITVQLSREMFASVVAMSHEFHDKVTTGEIVARFANDIFAIHKGLGNVFTKLFREPIRALLFLGIALSVNVYLTAIVVFFVLPVLGLIMFLGRKVKKNVRRSLQKVAALSSIVTETVMGIAIVKCFRMEEAKRQQFEIEIKKMRRYLLRVIRVDAAVAPAIEVILVLGLIAFVIMSEQQLSNGVLTRGQLFELFLALVAMLDPLRKLAKVNNMIQASVASAERVFAFVDLQPCVIDKPKAKSLRPLETAIRFEEIGFDYPNGQPALHNATFEIQKGEVVALVGFSGSGKSTIAKLLPRFYDPTEGRITFDGIDIRDCSLDSLRDQIGMVTQETILFQESIGLNIAAGNADVPVEAISAAAQVAHADEFIAQFPKGYATELDERGGNLSGGQRQRLAIARAILKDPSVLILDEATSNLDSESEKAIEGAIDQFVVGRTTLIIAHRLSTIQRADRVVVIDKGHVAEQGTHHELLAKNGIYRRLHDLQFGAAKSSSTP